ncbi:pentapeptide repeat-containing protein [Actinomadura fulvescens]|uniref:Pentapeptide repeat-containing protein n=1 Tax=Actinomadura fulvescens TaxID=46160 RepID=A0ABP6DCR4_9ACTN
MSESRERDEQVPDPLPSSGHQSEPELAPPGGSRSVGLRRRRGRRPRVTWPSQQELDALPVQERLELLDKQRGSRHQTLNSVGILFGVLFTAASLIATALTLRAGQQELRTSREGQITSRYIQATQQLGAAERDVRVSAIYALERLARDSGRDRGTISDVLAAFVREHDPALAIPDTKLPREPDTDVSAALTVIGRLHHHSFAVYYPDEVTPPDLHNIRTPGAGLRDANLHRANLIGANLIGADLIGAELIGAKLTGAKLTGADLSGAILIPTNQGRGDRVSLERANLARAKLIHTHLSKANLRGADLRGANLRGADLRCTDLYGAKLDDADLSGADLRGTYIPSEERRRILATADPKPQIGADTGLPWCPFG